MAGNTSQSEGASRTVSDVLHNETFRAILAQVILVGAVVLTAWYLVSNTLDNLAARQISTGFGYLTKNAGFEISDKFISVSAANSYGRALLAGLVNTLVVSLISIVLASLFGTIVGVSRLSKNWLVAKLALTYVEAVRNIPLLLQLIFWWKVITAIAPQPREALQVLPEVYFSNRGLNFPLMASDPIWGWVWLGLLVGIIGAVFVWRWANKVQARTGKRPAGVPLYLASIIGVPLLVWLVGGAPTAVDAPTLGRFSLTGGGAVSTALLAMIVGLTFYTSTFIAEIVRSGIQAVSHGQTEAGDALGLSRRQVLRLVVLPQALRVIIPPMTSQYLNITKNSSLGVAIGYQEIASITNTTLNQTGQAIEAIALMMVVYLSVSLTLSLLMNWYNHQIKLVER
jgi:general L-amino acid transport system permease protein